MTESRKKLPTFKRATTWVLILAMLFSLFSGLMPMFNTRTEASGYLEIVPKPTSGNMIKNTSSIWFARHKCAQASDWHLSPTTTFSINGVRTFCVQPAQESKPGFFAAPHHLPGNGVINYTDIYTTYDINRMNYMIWEHYQKSKAGQMNERWETIYKHAIWAVLPDGSAVGKPEWNQRSELLIVSEQVGGTAVDRTAEIKAEVNKLISRATAAAKNANLDKLNVTIEPGGTSQTITDVNASLGSYKIASKPAGVNVSISGDNKIVVSAPAGTSALTGQIKFVKKHDLDTEGDFAYAYFYENSDNQNQYMRGRAPGAFSIDVKVEEPFAYIGAKKVDEQGRTLRGIKFGVYKDAGATHRIKTMETDGSGLAVTGKDTDILVGNTYYVRELTLAEGQRRGYKISNTIYTAKPTSANTSPDKALIVNSGNPIKNDREQFDYAISKVDISGRKDNLNNAQFKLKVVSLVAEEMPGSYEIGKFVKSGGKDKVYTSNESGDVMFKKLPLGRYEIHETKSSNGGPSAPSKGIIVFEQTTPEGPVKVISNNTHSTAKAIMDNKAKALGVAAISLEPAGDNKFFNATPMGAFEIFKKDDTSGKGLQGAAFRVTHKSTADEPFTYDKTYTSGADGKVKSEMLRVGTYTIEEVTPPVGYLGVKSQVKIVEDSNVLIPVVFANERESFRFSFKKVDAEGKDTRKDVFDGVVFSVIPVSVESTGDGTTTIGKEFTTMTVKNGVANLPEGVRLPTGRYKVVEKTIPASVQKEYRDIIAGAELVVEELTHNGKGKVISNNTKVLAIKALNKDLVNLGGVAIEVPEATADFDFANKPNYGLLRIKKVNDGTGQGLDGAKFLVESKQWGYSKEYSTDKNGYIITEPLRVGAYKVTETQAPSAHADADPDYQDIVVVKADAIADAQDVVFKNAAQTFGFDVIKKSILKDSEYSMKGAEFELKVIELVRPGITNQKQPGELVGTYTTNDKGEFSVKGLPVGTYELKETKAPEGYVLNPNPVRIIAQWDKDGALIQETVEFDYGANGSAGADKLESMRQKLNAVWNALLPEDQIGSKNYTLEECGLASDFEEVEGKLTFAEIPAMGRFEISKHLDTNPEITPEIKPTEEGIIFEVRNAKGKLVDTLVTNHQGKAASKYLPVGKYTVSQMNTLEDAEGNPIVQKVRDFEVEIKEDGQVLHYQLENTPGRMRLRIVKLDEHTGETIMQEGVTFQIYRKADDSLVKFISYVPAMHETDKVVTGKDGYTDTMQKLDTGKYYLKELEGPEGYFFDKDTKFEFEIPLDKASAPDHVQIISITIGEYIEDLVKEDVTNLPQYGELTLNKYGELFKEWKLEKVTVKEQDPAQVEEVEVMKPQANVSLILTSILDKVVTETVEVEPEAPAPTEPAPTEPAPGTDPTEPTEPTEQPTEPTETTAPSEPVYETIEKVIQYEKVEDITTDELGHFEREVGKGSYKVTDRDGNEIFTLEVAEGETGKIDFTLPEIKVTEEKYVEGAVVDREYEVNVATYEEGFLAGAKFRFTAKEDINSYDKQTELYKKGDVIYFAKEDIKIDGKVVYKKGDAISAPKIDVTSDTYKDKVQDFVVTTAEKPLEVKRLPLGKYEMVEIEAPLGYKKDATVRTYEFTPQEHTVKVDLKESEKILNDRQILTITLNKKVVEETDYFGRGGYDNITFGVFNKEEVLGLKADSLVGVVTPDENGVMSLKDIPAGKYYFKELSTKNGYVLNENEYAINVSHVPGLDEDVVEVEETEVPNKPETVTEVKVIKVDVISGEPIEGVQFKLWAVLDDGTKVPVMNGDSDIWTTAADGSIIVPELPVGNYEWEEVGPAEGYVDEGTTVNVAVSKDANLEVTIGNNPTEMAFRKFDKLTGKPVIGAHLELLDEEGNTVMVNDNGYVAKDGDSSQWLPAIWKTDGEMHVIRGLKVGATYTLREIAAAPGYAKAEDLTFTVQNEKGLQLESLGNQLTSVRIIKKDWSSGEALNGATLELVDSTTGEVFVDAVTGKEARWTTGQGLENGMVFNGLVANRTYLVREVGVPDGYLAPLEDYALVVVDTEEEQAFVVNNEPVPEIKTQAAFADGYKENKPEAEVTVVDKVSYSKLIVGKTYVMNGTLVDANDPDRIIAKGSTTFIAESTSGTVDVVFKFSASELEGTTMVVFEDIFRDGRKLASHAEIQDKDQTVYVPEIRTKAEDGVDAGGTNDALASHEMKIIDVVSYKSLNAGQEYTVKGVLMDKATGEKLLVNGEAVTAEKTFIAESENGTVELEFVFDGSALAGKTVVVFESLYNEGKEIAVHADIEDEDQSIYIPKIGTTAKNSVNDGKDVSGTSEEVTIIDTVAYENLIPGEQYAMIGTLMNKATGEALEGVEPVRVEFVPEEANGTIDMSFTFNPKGLEGATLVVFEELERMVVTVTENEDGIASSIRPKKVAEHKDINDEGQSIYIPKISTSASDIVDGHKDLHAGEKATIVDIVTYENLLPGKEYTMKGVLMNKATNEPILINGEQVIAEKQFIAEAANGTVELEFTFDASALAGQSVVVFERLEREGIEVAVHADINDKDQTVDIPKIGTSASFDDGSKESNPLDKLTIVDKVSYENLIIGETYTVKGVLMDKATGQELLINGAPVVAEKTFVAETKDGFVEIVFEFEGKEAAGKELVVFEKMFNSTGKLVANHEDIEDEGQTVKVTNPEIKTSAKVNGGKSVVEDKHITVVDTVSYKDLIPGKEYTVRGILMDKATGQPILINGKQVTAEKTFIAESSEGTIDLEFKFDGTGLGGKELVVFEKLYEGESVIAVHEDINDEAQTVRIDKPDDKVQTDDGMARKALPYGLAVLALAGILALVLVIKKRKEDILE